MYSFDATDGDIIIESSDKIFFRCHSQILKSTSEFFKSLCQLEHSSNENNTTKITYAKDIISVVFNNIYYAYNNMAPCDCVFSVHSDYVNVLFLLDELKININMEEFKRMIRLNILKSCTNIWLDVLKKYYSIQSGSFQILITDILITYINDRLPFKEIEYSEIVSIDNEELKNKLIFAMMEKKKITEQKYNKHITKLCEEKMKYSEMMKQQKVFIEANNPIIKELQTCANHVTKIYTGYGQYEEIPVENRKIRLLVNSLKLT